MKLIQGKRIPLDEATFADAAFARFYDGHARRFMGVIYRRFAARAAGFKGKSVLDVGTGSGLLALEMAKVNTAWQITGVDISEGIIKLARENAARQNLSGRITFQQASAESLPFSDAAFGLVVSNASLHLWQGPVKVFNEMARVTAPGGYCLIRDNLRLAGLSPCLGVLGGLMGMNKDQRKLWLKAVGSAYTPGEAKALIKQSAMKDARVKANLSLLELGIEWHKRG
jgi:ubiquinone/menaquinone biosynthesis C-methylase UbiE